MYIALAQTNPTMGAVKDNARQALEVINSLAQSPYPPDLVIFPAYALTGTPVKGLETSDAFAAECLAVAHDFISAAKLPCLVGTMIPHPMAESMGFTSEPEVLYCKDGSGGALGFVDVHNNWVQEQYASSITVLLDGYTVSILLDDYPEMEDDFSSSDIIILMLAKEYRGTNSMFTASTQLGYIKAVAEKNNAWVLVANLVGAQDGSVFDGASLVVNPSGEICASAQPFIQETLTCNLDVAPPSPAVGAVVTKYAPTTAVSAPPSNSVKPLLPYQADWRAIKVFIRDYLAKNGFSDVVMGLSGGIDSAVVATLAVDALGAKHVRGILMPGPFSTPESLSDAEALAANLGIETALMPITELVSGFTNQSQAHLGTIGSALAQQNLQARFRAMILMHIANTHNYLLLNTSNKSECAMGFSTLYGDTTGAIAPLGNIYKTDVYGLANWRNQISAVIPQNSIDKEPSAELSPDQKDSDILPPYDVLDHILRMHIEEGLGLDQIMEYTSHDAFSTLVSAKLVKQVLHSVRLAEYKRRQEPLAPTLGYMDISADRNWPITNRFEDHEHLIDSEIDIVEFLNMIQTWKRPRGWDFLAN